MAILTDKTSMYNLMEFWLTNISPKYFDLKDTSLSSVGIFGYVNEIMAHMFEATANESSVLFNEIFQNKAVLPESILAYAAQYGVTDINAKPATMPFVVFIREDILLNNVINDGGETYFILDKDSQILVEDQIQYMLDYDIKVNVKFKDGDYLYSAVYNTFDERYAEYQIINPLSDIDSTANPYIKVTKIKQGNYNYIYLFVNAKQVVKTEVNKTIYKEDFIDFFSFDVDYVGNLAEFYVLYREAEWKNFIQLDKRIIDSAPTDKPFCYYQYRDDDTINISFSTMARHFKPKFNSELKIVMFTTYGADANFVYKGSNVKIAPKSNVYDYRNVVLNIQALGNSVDGKNKKTYQEIKDEVSYLSTTSFNIGTTIDLNKYFAQIERETKHVFIKKRDDILDRLFTSYAIMRDSDDNIIPSNTLDLKLFDEDFDSFEESTGRFVLKAGRTFTYDGINKWVRPYDTRTTSTSGSLGAPTTASENFIFANPFVTVVTKAPYSVSFYLNSIDKTIVTDFDYLNPLTLCNFITNNVNVSRDAMNGEDSYKITFSLIPNNTDINLDFAELTEDGRFIRPNANIVTKGVLYGEHDRPDYYFDFRMTGYEKSTKTMKFEAVIKTDDYISLDNSLRTINSIYRAKTTTLQTDALIQAAECKIGLSIFLKDDVPMHSDYHDYIPGMEEYSLSNVYKISETVNLINNLTKIMRTTLFVEPIDKDNPIEFFYRIKEVPFIRYGYMRHKKYAKQLVQIILQSAELLENALLYVTNNFAIDYKFYNTYGRSYYYYIRGDKEQKLDKINITLRFTIKLNPNKLLDEVLKTNIREYIKNHVENVNDDGNFYTSNLSTELETKFKDVIFVEFKNINGYDALTQSIEKDFPTDSFEKRDKIRDFVPEFITIDKNYDLAEPEDGVIVQFI